MNPIFILLVILGAGLVWVIGSFLFPIIGKMALNVWKELKININEEEEDI